jgi:hypothetical protein|tara:strand:- start:4 stop:423 length:420 start_codon:yes stop_codon:yes gene_type:complete
MSDKQPDWDKITEGKIRHGVAVEAFGKGMKLNAENMREIEKWVQFIIHGYDGIKEILDSKAVKTTEEPMSNEELKDEIVDKFDGEILDSDDYVTEQIDKAIVGLDKKNKNKVLYQLKNGNITTENLGACLDRIKELQKA